MNVEERLLAMSDAEMGKLLQKMGYRLESHNARSLLVAYFIPDGTVANDGDDVRIIDEIDTDGVQSLARDQLAGYMQPSKYIALNRFPKLANGKIDLARLPRPLPKRATSQTPHLAEDHSSEQSQSSPVFAALASALGPLLGMDDIRPDDNFFEIGGDSITAIQFISKVREAGYQLAVTAVSETGSMAELAAQCTLIDSIADASEPGSHSTSQSSADLSNEFAESGLNEQQLEDFINQFD